MKTILHLISVLFVCVFLSACHKDVSNDSITYDVDAQRFIDSSGITDGKQKLAINTFVIQLKTPYCGQSFWRYIQWLAEQQIQINGI
jgi:hypothetical protein